MTYYGGKQMAAAFRTVRTNTLTIADEIPEAHYGFQPSPESRTIARTLVHIGLGPTIQSYIQGNRIDDLAKVDFQALVAPMAAEEAKLRTKAEVVAFLRTGGESFASYLEDLPDAFLAEAVKVPDGMKSRFEMLLSVKEHEMHHRAQLMVAQRMLGLVPHITRQQQERFARAAAARK
jgi:uncharacterized damage-inducible protein DinB